MTKKKTNKTAPAAAALGIFLALAAVSPLAAQGRFTGDFLFGFRTVDTSGPGAASKYRSDLNLKNGARLFNLSFLYVPDEAGRRLFDRFEVTMVNLGGEPYETISASLQKYGRYLLKYDRRKSAYYYKDLSLGDGGASYDLQMFDFDRVADSGSAKLWLSQNVDVYFSFDRFTRQGASTTTQEIGREVFQFDKPIEETSRQIAVGLNIHYRRYSFVLETKSLNFKNDNSYFLPGAADGGPDAAYPTTVDSYFLNEPYELKTSIQAFRFTARPFDRLHLSGAAQVSSLTEDLNHSEAGSGINELNRKFRISGTGSGSFDRAQERYEFDLDYRLFRRLSLVSAVRYQSFDQTGSLAVNSETESVDFGFQTLGVDAGIQCEFSSRFILTFGYRFEDRKLDNLETVDYESKTTKNGGFGNLRWDISRRLKLTVDYEHSSYEDPFTLISPTSFDRLRTTARYQMGVFSLTATYLYNNSKSDIEEDMFKTSRNQFGLRAGFHTDKFKGFVGYTYLQAKRRGDRTVSYLPWWTVPGGSFLWNIRYEGKASILDASLSWDLNEFWMVGAWANTYANEGSYDIRRTMAKAFVEYAFGGGYSAQAGYRYARFREPSLGFNNYRANIFELSFGYRWK